MTFDQLKYFIEIVNCKSITKASKNLFISQAALTMSLQSLEKEIGFKLIERNYYGITLTNEGEMVFQDALEICSMQRKWQEAAQRNLYSQNFEIKIAVVNAVNNTIFSDFLMQFNEKYPNIILNALHGSQSEIEKYLQNNSCTVAVASVNVYIDTQMRKRNSDRIISSFDDCQNVQDLIEKLDRKGYNYRELLQSSYAVYVSKKHPLAEKEIVTPDELVKYKFIGYANEKLRQEACAELFDRNNMSYLVQQEHIFKAVAQNKGYTIFPQFMKNKTDLPYFNEIIGLPIKDYWQENRFYLAYPKKKNITEAEKILIKSLEKYICEQLSQREIEN